MPNAFTSKSDLLTYLHQFYREDADRTIRFLDPLYDEPLTPGRIPRCIAEDPQCQLGFQRLETVVRTSGLEVQLILRPHGSAEDWADIVHDHGDLLNPAILVAIESDWTATRNALGEYNDPIPVVSPPLDGGRAKFTEAQVRWFAENDKLALPCDIDSPVEGLRKQLLKLFAISEELDVEAGFSPREVHKFQAIARGAYHCIREWGMIGQLGYWLNRLAACDALPLALTIPCIMGSDHEPLAEKLTLLGISTTSYKQKKLDTDGELFVSMLQNCALLPELLHEES